MQKKKGRKMRLPNGFGSIVTLKGNRRNPYAAYTKTEGYTEDGHPIRKALGYFETWEDAYNCLLDYNKDPLAFDSQKITFAELYELFMKQKESAPKGLSQSNRNNLKAAYAKCEQFYQVPVSSIKSMHLQALMDSITDMYSVQFLSKVKGLWKQMYDLAMECDIVTKNYAQFVRINKNDDTEHSVPLTDQELDLLWKHLDDVPGADMVIVMCYTGHRISEYQQMIVDLDEMCLKGGIKTDAGRERVVPIHSRIQPIVIKLIEEHRMFGATHTTIRKTFTEVLPKCGITLGNHTPHDTRATFITRCNSAKVPDLHIKRMVGHISNDVTKDIYTSVPLSDLRESIELLK